MARTYKAVLHGDRVEWIDPPPEQVEGALAHITLLAPAGSRAKRGREMAEALGALAGAGALSGIDDPVAWQREARRRDML